MGRRRWQHYQQLFMENVYLKEEDCKQMEEKDWESSDKCNFCDESSNTSQQTVDNIVPESQEQPEKKSHSSESSYETEDYEEDTVAVISSGNNSTKFSQPPITILSNKTYKTAIEPNIPHPFSISKNKFNSMSSLESVASSVAASMAAVANITLQKSLGTLRFPSTLPADAVIPQWYLPSPNLKFEAPSKKDESDTEMADDQPLDLSAKSCSPVNSPTESPMEASSPVFTSAPNFPSSMIPQSPQPALKVYNSNRHLLVYKAKPRTPPMAGRRTYTEDELQAALRDIQSGKLGTRRAAVIYGIPRSTLRNKVYKLAMEKERDSAAIHTEDRQDRQIEPEVELPSDDKEELEDREQENEDEDEDIDKESSANEEEKEIEKSFIKPTFTVEDLIRLSKTQQNTTAPLVESESLRALFQGNSFLAEQSAKHKEKAAAVASSLPPPLYSIFPPGAAEIWGNLDPSSITPYLTHLMAATRENFNISTFLAHHQNPYLRQNCMNDSGNSSTTGETPFSPKLATPLLPELVQRMLAESEEQQKHENQKELRSSYSLSPTTAGSITPSELTCDERGNTSPNILNRLPFFKPSYKNGSTTTESTFCNMEYSNENRNSEGSEKSTTSSPPPTGGAIRSESSSPLLPVNHSTSKVGGLNLRDVIAKTIGQRFQQSDITMNSSSHLPSMNSASLEMAQQLSYSSHSGNSVIKSHNSMQTEEHHHKICATQSKVPSLTSASAAVAAMSSASSMVGAAAGSGKGTRPKRGKYRNYDRDSLIEAVRAVQRGEMSVHRAGSHFGVPHSTLEYKVKERHLLRPRKREPKNPLSDELKRRDEGVLRLSIDKPPSSTAGATISTITAAQPSPSSQPSKLGIGSSSSSSGKSQFTPPHLSSASTTNALGSTPNGLKIPTALFEGTHPFVPAPPFPFWPAHFHQLAMEYSHNPAAAAAAAAAFSSNPERLLASHFIQRMQEEAKSNVNLPVGLTSLGKNAREVAESLYDGSGINGNFLDGVIRSSLDNDQAFSDSIHKRSLLEQLYKNKYLNPNNSFQGDESDCEDGGGSDGGSGSKSNFNQILAQTLLSSINAKEKMAQIPIAKGKDGNGDGKDDISHEVNVLPSDREEIIKNMRIDEKNAESRSNVPNQSLNVESHIINAQIKMEKN